MTLKEYIAEQKTTLDNFEQHWKAGVENDPLNFPSTLGIGDWDEQLLNFIDLVPIGENHE